MYVKGFIRSKTIDYLLYYFYPKLEDPYKDSKDII